MEYRIEDRKIRVSLPITTSKSKVRVKRPVSGHEPEPVACRSIPVRGGDYLEWQISYDTPSLNEPSVLKKVVLNKPQGVRYGCELVRLIVESRKIGILSRESFFELKALVNAPLDAGIEELERVQREEDSAASTIATEYGFVRHYLRVPNYIKNADAYSVEIKIGPKQKAVGNQAMVYVHLHVSHCRGENGRPLIGRYAEKNEKAEYLIGADNGTLIYDTVTAFALASVDHRNDLKMIFELL